MPAVASRAAALLLTCLLAGAALAGERGYFGFALKVSRGFFLAPVANELAIARVLPDTPAARAGMRRGDRIVEVDGQPVAGARALALKASGARDVGQTLRLTLRRPDGEIYRVEMVAVARPK